MQTAGQIVDDDLNKALVRPIPDGCILHALIDACHSGTGLDLRYVAMIDKRSGQVFWTDEGGRCALISTSLVGPSWLMQPCPTPRTVPRFCVARAPRIVDLSPPKSCGHC
jgi:hypothetical protein